MLETKIDTKISVAICTYNGEKYISEQIDSILNQTITPHEIIVVDDGSSDKTISILQGYLKFQNFKIFSNEKKLGFVKNFEKAISLCSGEIILLSDQDDIWIKDKIELLLNEIRDSLLIYSNALLVNSNLESLNKNVFDYHKTFPVKGSNCLAFLFNNCVSGNTIMFKRELLSNALPFPDNMHFHDIYLAFTASVYGTINFVDKDLVLYRQHNDSITDRAGVKIGSKKNKIESKIISNQKRVLFFKALLNTKALQESHRSIIESLVYYFEDYEQYFFKLPLLFLLFKHKRAIFEIDKNISLLKIIKLSLGLKAYKLFPFL